MKNLESLLNADDGRPSKSWKPKIGDYLIGKYVRLDNGHSEYGDSNIAVIESETDGILWGVWLTSTVLTAEFYKASPVPGDRIAVKRLEDNTDGKVYKRYRVIVDHRDTKATPEAA